MKKLIMGIIVIIIGIFRSVWLIHKQAEDQELSGFANPVPDPESILFPHLIVIGLMISTAGLGDIVSKKRIKKRRYYQGDK